MVARPSRLISVHQEELEAVVHVVRRQSVLALRLRLNVMPIGMRVEAVSTLVDIGAAAREKHVDRVLERRDRGAGVREADLGAAVEQHRCQFATEALKVFAVARSASRPSVR